MTEIRRQQEPSGMQDSDRVSYIVAMVCFAIGMAITLAWLIWKFLR